MSKKINFLTAIFVIFCSIAAQSFASPRAITSVNYFASLRANETNVRAGPGQNYPIKFSFKLRGIPVRVINEYDNWNEIEDFEGQSGWVTQSLLTKKRTLLVRTTKNFINMHRKNNEKSRIIFRLENNVIGDYLKCLEDWCGIKINGKKGWVLKDEVFGAGEELN
jgi:SH3-like domain-containing protein